MIKKFLSILFLTIYLMVYTLSAFENELKERTFPKDRYQMMLFREYPVSTEIYLLDKEKGTIWMTKSKGFGDFNYHPWVQLPSLPLHNPDGWVMN